MGVILDVLKVKHSLNEYFNVKLALKSESTKRSAKFALDKYSIFCDKYHKSTPDKIISEIQDNQEALDILQQFVNWYSVQKTQQGEKPSSRTVRIVFHIIRKYFRYMGIKIHSEDVKDDMELPTVLKKDKHGVKLEEIIKILENVSFRKKCLYLAQISSGMRIGELLQLRKKDLDLNNKRIIVHIQAENTKKRKGRITFFSKEFDKLYRFKINQMNDDQLLFTSNPRVRDAVNNETQNMQYVCNKVGLKNITTHSFRAYFITKMMRHDRNLSFMLTGQDGYLMEYDRLDEDEKLEKYIEYEGDLLIFEKKPESAQIKEIKKDLEAKIDQMQEQLNSFAELNQDLPMTLRKDPKTGKMNLESVDVDMDMFHAGGNEAKADLLRKQRQAKNQK